MAVCSPRPGFPPAEAALITLVAAVALCRTIRDLYALQPGLKWPNDVLVDGAKLAGVLVEVTIWERAVLATWVQVTAQLVLAARLLAAAAKPQENPATGPAKGPRPASSTPATRQ